MFSRRSFSLYGGHEDEVHCLIFSRDLEILLTGSVHGCIRLWNTVYDCLTFKIQDGKGRIRTIAISNNDQYFASTANDVYLRLYQTRNGRLVRLLSGHAYPSDCLHFSSNSQLIASGAWDHRTIVWSVTTGAQVHNFGDHTNAVQSIAFHPVREIMITGSHDHDIFLYDFEKQPLPAPLRLQGHSNTVQAIAFSCLPYFASAGWDKSIIIWHLDMRHMYSRLFNHEGWIQALAFRDDDGSILASVDDDTVHVWNIVTRLCLRRLRIVNDLTCFVRFLPNHGGMLVGGTIYEPLFDQQVPPRRARLCTKRVNEPLAGETKLLSSPTDRHVKLPKLRSKRTHIR